MSDSGSKGKLSIRVDRLLGEPGSLKRKSTNAVIWLWSGGLVRGGIGLVITGILARALGASPYGLYAVVVAVVNFCIYLADAGIAVSLIQRETVSENDIRSCHTYAFGQGIVVGILAAIAAYPICRILNNPELFPVLVVSSLAIPFAAWGTTSIAILRRDLRHRDNQWCGFAAYVIGQLMVTLPLAKAHWGIWALVSGLLAQWFSQSLILWLVTRHSIKPCFERDSLSNRFTWSILMQNLSITCLAQLDQMFFVRTGLPATVGVYNRGKWAVEAPNMYVVPAVQSVVLSAASRSQKDPRRIKSLILKAVAISSVSGSIVLIASIIWPTQIIHFLLGNKFLAAAPILPILALERLLWCMFTPIGQTLNGVGRPELEAKSMFALVPIALIVYYFASMHGSAMAVAWGIVTLAALRLGTQSVVMWLVYKGMVASSAESTVQSADPSQTA